jgi:putative endonuclease
MAWEVYMVRSRVLGRYYVGFSENAQARLAQHRAAKHGWTSRATDWDLVVSMSVATEREARLLEKRIKARGAERFLESISRRE